MGLSSEQVSVDGGQGWSQTLELKKPPAKRQQPPQPSEKLNCPRCDSTNTKFCYYNNYNKSQPRHFCRNCKRHWTKGGTLRNVPVGGGRKNKRPKTSNSGATATNKGSSSSQFQEQRQNQVQFSGEINFPALNFPGNDMFPGSISTFPVNQNQSSLNFPFPSSSSSSFDTNPSSISTNFQSPDNVYEAIEFEDPNFTMAAAQPPWKPPCTGSAAVDMIANYWNWEDIDALVSTDLNTQWDYDSETKFR